jgi:hypothetical protein
MDEQARKELRANMNKPAVALGDQAERLSGESEAVDPGDPRKDLAELAAWAREMRDLIPEAVPGPVTTEGPTP